MLGEVLEEMTRTLLEAINSTMYLKDKVAITLETRRLVDANMPVGVEFGMNKCGSEVSLSRVKIEVSGKNHHDAHCRQLDHWGPCLKIVNASF